MGVRFANNRFGIEGGSVWFWNIGMESNDLIKKVVQICYDVHRELGCGYVEKVYENSLVIALREAGFDAVAQYPLNVSFRGQVVGEFFVDILVEGALIVELKAVSAVDAVHKAQVLNYLKAANRESGLLVNFGALKLEVKRLYNQHFA